MKEHLIKYCINESETIYSAIEHIEQNNMRTVLILDNSDKVVGLVSQGDILSAIIEGTNLYAQVKKIMTTSFSYMKSMDLQEAVQLFVNKYYSLIPVISDDFELIDVILFQISYISSIRPNANA